MKNVDKNNSGSFSDFEREAMKNRAKELRAEAKAGKKREAGEKMLLDAIKEMKEPDKSIAVKIHAIVSKIAPKLWPKTWYGMPAYANESGKVVCFFQPALKFEARYATLGFTDSSKIDDGNMFPNGFAIKKLTPVEEKKITELVKKAVS